MLDAHDSALFVTMVKTLMAELPPLHSLLLAFWSEFGRYMVENHRTTKSRLVTYFQPAILSGSLLQWTTRHTIWLHS